MVKPYIDAIHKPMSEEDLDRAMIAYGALMGEAKTRLKWLEYAVTGKTGLPPALMREHGFLQLRLICELIALGCLVIHGDIEQTSSKKFKTYAADEILANLERLTPEFYPRPFIVSPNSEPNIRQLVFIDEDEFLTKKKFFALYTRKCGTALHRGSLDKLKTEVIPSDLADIPRHARLLYKLLHTHFILFAQNKRAVFCEFGDMNDANVRVTLGEV